MPKKTKNDFIPVTFRIPPDLKAPLEQIAQSEHWSQNQAILEAIKLLIKDKLSHH